MNSITVDNEVYNYNFSCKYSDLPDAVKRLVYQCNKCYINRFDINESDTIYFTLDRDYYLEVNCFYIDKNNEYHFINIDTRFNKYDNSFYVNRRLPFGADESEIVNYFTKMFDNKFELANDYDLEQINEAIELGDFSLVSDIVGDRDLAEFI